MTVKPLGKQLDNAMLSTRLSGLTATASQYLHTGDPFFDTMVSLFLAWLLSTVLTVDWRGLVSGMGKKATGCFAWMKPREFQRDVAFTAGEGAYVNAQIDRAAFDEKDRNFLLQKAMILHLMRTDGQKGQNMATADARLTLARDMPLETNCHRQKNMFSGSARQLAAFEITYLPASGEWVCIDKQAGLWFRRKVEDLDNGPGSEGGRRSGDSRIRTTLSLKCTGPNAHDKVQGWIEDAMAEYRKSKEAELDNNRYYYVPRMEEGESGARIVYKRWPLSDDKNFSSLFFPEKPRMLQLVADFEAKKGKFAVEGRPHRLPFLLHGPPGTGKTSFIKALASHTKRHIVEVPLAHVCSDHQLLDSLMDLRLSVDGEDQPVALSFKEVVFVIEDVDAAGSDVVLARGTLAPQPEPVQPVQPVVLAATGGGQAAAASAQQYSLLGGQKDQKKLTLSGLLNALDGAIDTPGRIVVMTTNHPEKLDPALKRPGRMREVLLDFLRPAELCQMVAHYLQLPQLTPSDRAMISAVADEFRVSPAQVEECSDSADDVASLVSLLRQRLAMVGASSCEDDDAESDPEQLSGQSTQSAACSDREES